MKRNLEKTYLLLVLLTIYVMRYAEMLDFIFQRFGAPRESRDWKTGDRRLVCQSLTNAKRKRNQRPPRRV